MQYRLFKDSEPVKTVEKIKDILYGIGFSVEEKMIGLETKDNCVPYSLRVQFPDCGDFGTNGKGTSLVNAKASAYAEFLERCQNGILIPFETEKFIFAPDEKLVESELLFNNNFFKYVNNQNLILLLNELANKPRKKIDAKEQTLLVPFFSYSEKKDVDLPILLFELLQGSNGMAAGNTLEEALVQGISEICERFSMKVVIEGKCSMPDIPETEYLKYEKVSGMIKKFESYGFCVSVKDASLGLGFPVVCVVVNDLNTKNISFSFGSHPSLPVAIERCLTEYAQGVDITMPNKINSNITFLSKDTLIHLDKSNNLKYLFEKQFIHHVYLEECEVVQKILNSNESSYKHDSSVWISDMFDGGNRGLLGFLLKRIKDYTDEIYIRDVSYLGFPSVYVVIPKMSFVVEFDEQRANETLNLYNWLMQESLTDNESIELLYKSLSIRESNLFFLNAQFSEFPNEYIFLLCSIFLQDYQNIKKFSSMIIEKNMYSLFFRNNFIDRVRLINDYFSLKSQNYEHSSIITILKDSYTTEQIKGFCVFIKYLSADIIKKTIKPYESKRRADEQYTRNQEKLEKISDILSEQYEKNVKNQCSLFSVFEGL